MEELVKIMQHEILQCKLCFENYSSVNNSNRIPKILLCSHFFCQECLISNFNYGGKNAIYCPTCQKETPICNEDGIKKLPTDCAIQIMQNILNDNKITNSQIFNYENEINEHTNKLVNLSRACREKAHSDIEVKLQKPLFYMILESIKIVYEDTSNLLYDDMCSRVQKLINLMNSFRYGAVVHELSRIPTVSMTIALECLRQDLFDSNSLISEVDVSKCFKQCKESMYNLLPNSYSEIKNGEFRILDPFSLSSVCDDIFRVMLEMGKTNSKIASLACSTIALITHQNSAEGVYASPLICSDVVGLLRIWPDDGEMVHDVCSALYGLSLSVARSSGACGEETCQELTHLLLRHVLCPDLLETICLVLGNLAGNRTNATALLAAGCAEALVVVLRQWAARCAGGCEYAVYAVHRLAAAGRRHRRALVGAGCFEALMAVCGGIQGEGATAAAAAAALSRLAPAAAALKRLRPRTSVKGVGPLLSNWSHRPLLLKRLCRTISALGGCGSRRCCLGETGCCNALADCLLIEGIDAGLWCEVCRAIRVLCRKNAANVKRFCLAGAVGALADELKTRRGGSVLTETTSALLLLVKGSDEAVAALKAADISVHLLAITNGTRRGAAWRSANALLDGLYELPGH